MEIDITLGETTVVLRLGAFVDDVRTILKAKQFTQVDDPEVDAVNLELPNDGLEILFKGGRLSTVFLHLARPDGQGTYFNGATNFLGRSFFEDPSAEDFERILATQGFVRSLRQYPFAIDMLTDKVRLRYEDRRDQRLICFDSGDRIRAA